MLSLYRRHRPKTFDEVVGQDRVVRTLRNAIELGKVHHAYLFVGSRGTGKTSMAKLLACALNAEDGPRVDFSPDDPACRAIMNGSSLDVVEMDAASNNSVDDIRELRENIALTPMGGARRVYILDEAHMLSTPAWNAFLKTLEEPPAHVVFVLATTEAHKVPATIVDRCHRFDFAKPSLEQIAGVLRRVADEEEIEIPDGAVGMIARKATGSFRDALGTLEQLVTYGGRKIALEDVLDTLGVADADLILQATDALIAREPATVLRVVRALNDSGRDEVQFMRDLSAHLRHLYVLQLTGEEPDSFAVTAGREHQLAEQAEKLAQGDVLRAIDLLAAAIAQVKDGSEPRLQLEVALLKATRPQADQSLGALMFRIDQLEGRIGGSSAPAARGGSAEAPQAQSGRSAAPAAHGGGGGGGPIAAATAVIETAREAGGAAIAAAAAIVQPDPETAPALPAPDLERIRELWAAVADAVRDQNAMVAALLADALPTALDGDRLTVAFPADAAFMKKKAETHRELLLSALRTLTGQALAVTFELGAARDGAGPATLSGEELFERLKRDFGAEELLEAEPEPDED